MKAINCEPKSFNKGSTVRIVGGNPAFIGDIDIVKIFYPEKSRRHVQGVLLKNHGLYDLKYVDKIKEDENVSEPLLEISNGINHLIRLIGEKESLLEESQGHDILIQKNTCKKVLSETKEKLFDIRKTM